MDAAEPRRVFLAVRVRPAAKEKLVEMAAARGVSLSEMVRIVMGAGIAALGAGR